MPRITRADLVEALSRAMGREGIAPEVALRKMRRLGRGFSVPMVDGVATGLLLAELPIDSMDCVVKPVVDLMGSTMYERMEISTFAGTSGAPNVNATVVPDNQLWLYLAAHVIHNDTVSKAIWVAIDGPLSVLSVALSITDQAAAGLTEDSRPVPLRRPVLLPPKFSLAGRSRTALTAGKVLTLQTIHIPLALGEYTFCP